MYLDHANTILFICLEVTNQICTNLHRINGFNVETFFFTPSGARAFIDEFASKKKNNFQTKGTRRSGWRGVQFLENRFCIKAAPFWGARPKQFQVF